VLEAKSFSGVALTARENSTFLNRMQEDITRKSLRHILRNSKPPMLPTGSARSVDLIKKLERSPALTLGVLPQRLKSFL